MPRHSNVHVERENLRTRLGEAARRWEFSMRHADLEKDE